MGNRKRQARTSLAHCLLVAGLVWSAGSAAWAAPQTAAGAPDPATRLRHTHPADKWENALPVGNGRLGAMAFGKTDEEQIQLNEVSSRRSR